MAGIAVVTVAALGLMIGAFWSMTSGTGFFSNQDSGDLAASDSVEEPQQQPQPQASSSNTPKQQTPTPTPTPSQTQTPPAPSSNELVSGQWLMSPYAILKDDNKLIISGTLQNRSQEKKSGEVRVFVYVNGQAVAAGTDEVVDVAPGGAVDLFMPTGQEWVPGNKVLYVDVIESDG